MIALFELFIFSVVISVLVIVCYEQNNKTSYNTILSMKLNIKKHTRTYINLHYINVQFFLKIDIVSVYVLCVNYGNVIQRIISNIAMTCTSESELRNGFDKITINTKSNYFLGIELWTLRHSQICCCFFSICYNFVRTLNVICLMIGLWFYN